MIVEAAARSDPGRIRPNNEDNALICKDTEGQWCDICVCDGMGGESYGEVASYLAVKKLEGFCNDGMGGRHDEIIAAINAEICAEIAKRKVARMGSTIAHLHIEGGIASACNIGDSRIYLYSKGILMQISEDHRTKDPSTGRNYLTQNLGIDPEDFVIEPSICRDIKIESGMIFVLCSDGLTDMVNDNELQKVMDNCRGLAAKDIADRLVSRALSNGGRDNVTVAVAKISE